MRSDVSMYTAYTPAPIVDIPLVLKQIGVLIVNQHLVIYTLLDYMKYSGHGTMSFAYPNFDGLRCVGGRSRARFHFYTSLNYSTF
jgi:hypothetical protein